MGVNLVKTTSVLIGRDDEGGRRAYRPYEQRAEIHACKRLHERYGVPFEMTPEVMIEHLALILAGESVLCNVELDERHYGKEIRLVNDRGIEFVVCYDPRIMRIVTYLPKTTEVTRRQTRAARTVYGKRRKERC